jgi:molybdopterin/thiamine biosynthesis adenylyltransferase
MVVPQVIDTTRQSGILAQERLDDITVEIVGCGAIGSHTAETMTKVGIRKLTLWDYDTVETHNLANQGYYIPDLGQYKVNALSKRLGEGTGAKLIARNQKFEKAQRIDSTILISAVDNMATRQILWDSFCISPDIKLFIDGRMSARFGQVFTITKDSDAMALYENSLFPDSEAHREPCTEKSTIFCAYGLAGFICAQMFNYLKEGKAKEHIEVCFRNMISYQVQS